MDQTQRRAVPTQPQHNAIKPAAQQQLTNGLTVNTNVARVTTRNGAQQQRQQQLPQQQPLTTRFHNVQQPPANRLTPYQQLYASQESNPQYVFEYCEDISNALLESEQKYLIRSNYMESQHAINPKYREVLIDWLSSVRGKYRLKIDTFALCISILDRFLERREITKDKLQLVGCTALWIAAKYEEIYPPELEDLILISDRNFTREQFIMMERIILTILDFNVTIPYAHHFAERYIQALPDEIYPNKTVLQNISMYIIESSYQHYCFVGHLTSQLATAAVSLALFFTQHPSHFPSHLHRASGYQYADVSELFDLLWSNIAHVHTLHELKKEQQAQGARPTKVFDSVYRLYMTDAWAQAPLHITPYDQEAVPPTNNQL